ncbi:MAG TPA: TlpA disulfide reductase family protein [Terracidiphilus sp.]|nr:TlpA disulfide reductase family protein [Terracidiphilus sp.]
MKRTCVLVAALFCGLLAPMAQAKRAPNFQLKDLDGHAHHVADLRGSVVVLNFWATWCGPCREELPMLTRLSKDYAPRHVRFIAASADENKDRAKVARFVHDHDLGMDVWVGANLDMLDSAKLGNELPATLILDADGNIITRIKGEAREKDVRDALDWILGGEKGAAPPAVVTHY